MQTAAFNPQQAVEQIVAFLQSVFAQQSKQRAVIAVSGGIDSGASLTLVTQALGPDRVTPIFLPHGDQSTTDAKQLVGFNNIPEQSWVEVDIKPMVAAAEQQLKSILSPSTRSKEKEVKHQVRLGNLMARSRMIIIYDVAKRLDALVCGTENKSEKYLGYFTRFGDEASDVEPIQHLLKTQVRALAKHLQLPEHILTKPPSAGLWPDQTDADELGFEYSQADQVLVALEKLKLIDHHGIVADRARILNSSTLQQIANTASVDLEVVKQVVGRINSVQFKHQVPYCLQISD